MMECPHCHKEIEGKACPACETVVPAESRYCMQCGAALATKMPEPQDPEDAFELEDRTLCPDGSCTGIIVEGKCSECGKPLTDAPPGT